MNKSFCISSVVVDAVSSSPPVVVATPVEEKDAGMNKMIEQFTQSPKSLNKLKSELKI